ncbi:MAG: hypothetical protein AAGA62_18180, partial [Bacteroidota bacterium]
PNPPIMSRGASALVVLANRKIGTSKQETQFTIEGGLDEIIDVIRLADRKAAPFTRDFAPLLRGSTPKRTLYNIWKFVRKNIRYVADPNGHEKIKSPGATWASRYADCKSMSLFVGSILRNLDFRYTYRVVFYDRNNPERGHIYPVVLLDDGQEVIVDTVHYAFNEELVYWKGYNYDPETGYKAKVSGIQSNVWTKWAILGLGALLVLSGNRKSAVLHD